MGLKSSRPCTSTTVTLENSGEGWREGGGRWGLISFLWDYFGLRIDGADASLNGLCNPIEFLSFPSLVCDSGGGDSSQRQTWSVHSVRDDGSRRLTGVCLEYDYICVCVLEGRGLRSAGDLTLSG